MDAQNLLAAVIALEPKAEQRPKCGPKFDQAAVSIPNDILFEFMHKLRNKPELEFDILYTHTAIDLPEENRIELIYQLFSLKNCHYLLVSTSVPRNNPITFSVNSIWQIAQWQEREVYDMFGVLYRNHDDLRRLFLEDDWQGFPLLKDYKDDFMLERPQ